MVYNPARLCLELQTTAIRSYGGSRSHGETLERWLPVAVGNPSCVDHLISFLGALPPDQQVRLGLQWVSAVVLPDPESVARSSFLLSSWLIEARASATEQGLLPRLAPGC